jgi:hypothetical protein
MAEPTEEDDMPIELEHDAAKKVLTVTVSGKLEADDYTRLGPQVEDFIRKDEKLDILLVLHDFHGWTAGALWEDIKFDAKHFRDIGKLAIAGETKWEKGMATFCKPFTTAKIQYFPSEEIAAARKWLGLAD